MNKPTQYITLSTIILSISWIASLSLFCSCTTTKQKSNQTNQSIEKLDWRLVFEDDMTEDYEQYYHMDGTRSTIEQSPNGLTLTAGPEAHNDTCHTVLWTKERYSSPVQIEYDYTRLDSSQVGVNILYLLASGMGDPQHPINLMDWNEGRQIPAMRTYFNHVDTYHFSYATFGNGSLEPSYIRARRYLPDAGQGLDGTALTPDYWEDDLFAVGVKHHIKVTVLNADIIMEVTNDDTHNVYHFDSSTHPTIDEGHIGFRHMWTRSARYSNLKIYQL